VERKGRRVGGDEERRGGRRRRVEFVVLGSFFWSDFNKFACC